MKLHNYHITFRKALSTEQEDLLIGYIKGMLENMEVKYRTGQNKFRNDPILKVMFRMADKAVIQTITSRIEGLLVTGADGKPLFYSYYNLDKTDDSHYIFSAPDPDDLMGVAGALAAFPKPLLNMFKTIVAGDKDATMKFLRGTLKEVGVEEGGYKITLGD